MWNGPAVACLAALLLGVLTGCSGRRPADGEEPAYRPRVITPRTPLPTPVDEAAPPAPAYVPPTYQVVRNHPEAGFVEPVSSYDVLRTVLDIRLDIPGERVIGSATHRLRTLAGGLTALPFHGRDMEIHSATLLLPDGTRTPLEVRYDGQVLTVSAARPFERDTFDVSISYTAYPTRNGRRLGMHFVDPAGTDASKPTQVWTLGQPEDNRYWYPGWDYPNDPTTVDLLITVPAALSTVANGRLVEQIPLADGSRRDHWRLSRPHATYLTGFAAGEFAPVIDRYFRRDGSQVPLAYLVEPAYEAFGSLIFGETPRMIGVFEETTGVPYPWENYKQVAVHEFTAGGMENTTAAVFFDGVQHDDRGRIDYNARDLIAHELAHQWFGNYVTCRNWAYLPLNEGFATYFERIYLERGVGMDDAQWHTIETRADYLDEAKSLRRPIVWFGYEDPNALYDRHTYQKMALALHYLRFELGEGVWWNGVRRYLRDNAYRNVGIDDLRKAMEQASGRNLGTFFQQWMLSPGHPELEVEQHFDAARGLYEVRVHQVQDSLLFAPYRFDVGIELNLEGAAAPFTQRFAVTSRDTTFRFALAGDVAYTVFDPGDWLLADIRVDKPMREWIAQARFDDELSGRYLAVTTLGGLAPEAAVRDALLEAMSGDASRMVRRAAATGLTGYAGDPLVRTALAGSIRVDADPTVRRAALLALAPYGDEHLLAALRGALADPSSVVVGEAVRLLARTFPVEAPEAIRGLFGLDSWRNTVERAMIDAYAQLGVPEGTAYLEARLAPSEPEDVRIAAAEALGAIARAQPAVAAGVGRALLSLLADGIEAERFAAAQALRVLPTASFQEELRRALARETSDRVRQQLETLVGS